MQTTNQTARTCWFVLTSILVLTAITLVADARRNRGAVIDQAEGEWNGIAADGVSDNADFAVSLPFEITVDGTNYSELLVSANGFVSLGGSVSFDASVTDLDELPPIILAPFYGDFFLPGLCDVAFCEMEIATLDLDEPSPPDPPDVPLAGEFVQAVRVTWTATPAGVDNNDLVNAAQLRIVNRANGSVAPSVGTPTADFDIEFNYDRIVWEHYGEPLKRVLAGVVLQNTSISLGELFQSFSDGGFDPDNCPNSAELDPELLRLLPDLDNQIPFVCNYITIEVRGGIARLGGFDADLEINVTDLPDTVSVGEEFAFDVALTNLGPDPALGTSFSVTLPPGVALASAPPPSCEQNAEIVNCDLANIANGAAVTTRLNLFASQAGPFTLVAEGNSSALQADDNQPNNLVTEDSTAMVVPRFDDVPIGHFAFEFIEIFAAAGITTGCGNNMYCPDAPVTRAQMAVFIERAIHGGDFVPPEASGNVFLDVAQNDFAANYIERIFLEGITSGCGNNRFCPDAPVTRAQMAVFIERGIHGGNFQPQKASGTVFLDVAQNDFAADYIEEFFREGITSGCGDSNYCPHEAATRAQMAVFLVRAFNLG